MRLSPLRTVIGLLRGFCSRAFGINVGSSLTKISMNVKGKKRGSTHDMGDRKFGKSERYVLSRNLLA